VRGWLGLLVWAACAHAPDALPPASTLGPAEALAAMRARRPERYKMVHQVVARYAGESYVMIGYMLGKRDGTFRVSASAAVGPQLFDVGKREGTLWKEVHFAPLEKKLDALHIARAIDRLFIAECAGDGERQGERYVYRCALAGDEEADGLVVELDARTLAVVRKAFTAQGAEQATVVADLPRQFGGEWIPTRYRLSDKRGYALDVVVSEYQPGFAFDDALLRVSSAP
jgi:hypothetical protein